MTTDTVPQTVLFPDLFDKLKLPRYKKPYEGRRVGVDYARNGQKRASLQPDGSSEPLPRESPLAVQPPRPMTRMVASLPTRDWRNRSLAISATSSSAPTVTIA